MQRRFPAANLLARFSTCYFLCPVCCYGLYYITIQRVHYVPESPNFVQAWRGVFRPGKYPRKNTEKIALKTSTIVPKKTPKVEENIWCKALEYKDLSSHPVFNEFNLWIQRFKEINCTDAEVCLTHDPRLLSNLLIAGNISLVRARRFSNRSSGVIPERQLIWQYLWKPS